MSTHTPGRDKLEDLAFESGTGLLQYKMIDCWSDVSMRAVSASVFLDKDISLCLPHLCQDV